MPSITYTLTDFGMQSLAARFPTVKFIPSSPGIAGDRLFTSTPVETIPDAAGIGAVTLASTDNVSPNVWYTVRIEHLNSGGVPTHLDILNLKLFIPEGYNGPLSALPGVPTSPSALWTNLLPPPAGFQGLWLYSPAPGQSLPDPEPEGEYVIGDLRPVS